VDVKDVLDLDGKVAALSVILSNKPDSTVTADSLREQIEANTALEFGQKAELAKAREAGDIERVNRLVAEIADRRQRLIEDNGVISYKLSLSTKSPPILAFWPGLPFEMVRHNAAKALAEQELGKPAVSHELVSYMSTTSLICFSAADGQKVYVDPFRVAEVPVSTLTTESLFCATI